MANPFGADGMAAGYANSRPAVHPLVIEHAVRQLKHPDRFLLALDVGCGAGVSTRALTRFTTRCIGLEPAEAMLQWTTSVAPSAEFIVGTAEDIPLRDQSADLITAAGSLNYVNLDRFFPEACRVLTPNGVLLIYDFSPGRNFRDTTTLNDWFSAFQDRYPSPEDEARRLDPEILARLDSGFRMLTEGQFEIGLTLTPEFYLEYVMTETNVAFAIRKGVARAEIRSWCAATLGSIWTGEPREVRFRGYFAWMTPSPADGYCT